MKRIMVAVLLMMLAGGCATVGNKNNGDDPNYDQTKGKKAVKVTQTTRGAQISSDERILFNTGKSEIKGEGKVFIDRVAVILKEKTKADISVEGHTDNVGGSELNMKLSKLRANAVKQALIARGVSAGRIKAQGFGMSKPIESNATLEGREANRRTDIIVLGESVDNIGGTSLGDRLSEGLDRFLKDAGAFISNVFGDKKSE